MIKNTLFFLISTLTFFVIAHENDAIPHFDQAFEAKQKRFQRNCKRASGCLLISDAVEGPYYVDLVNLLRSDIRFVFFCSHFFA